MKVVRPVCNMPPGYNGVTNTCIKCVNYKQKNVLIIQMKVQNNEVITIAIIQTIQILFHD
jgi:hypothetical protein